MSTAEGHRLCRIAIPAILVLGIAGCGGAAASGAAGQSPSTPSAASLAAGPSTTEAPATASATASDAAPPSTEPSTAGGTLCTTGGSMATGTDLTVTAPNAGMNLPGGWEPMDIADYGELLTQAATAANDPRLTKAVEWQTGLIADGVMRTAASGPSGPSGAQASLVVSVLPVTGGLQATVDARLNDEATNGIPIKVLEVGATALPIGDAYCAGLVSDIDIGTPSQTIEYIAQEPGGKAISLAGTAPVTDTGFPDIVRSIALSLAAD